MIDQSGCFAVRTKSKDNELGKLLLKTVDL